MSWRLERQIFQLERRINRLEDQMVTQADLDNLTSAIEQAHDDLSAGIQAVQDELNALEAANPALDLNSANAAIQELETAVTSVGNLKPIVPAPAQPQAGDPQATATDVGTGAATDAGPNDPGTGSTSAV